MVGIIRSEVICLSWAVELFKFVAVLSLASLTLQDISGPIPKLGGARLQPPEVTL
jgi:hypothetical protein